MQLITILGLAAAAAVASAKPTVYFIRHGEKPSDDGDGLSAQGMQRAQCLRNVFGASSGYDIGYILAQTPKSSTFQIPSLAGEALSSVFCLFSPRREGRHEWNSED